MYGQNKRSNTENQAVTELLGGERETEKETWFIVKATDPYTRGGGGGGGRERERVSELLYHKQSKKYSAKYGPGNWFSLFKYITK